MTELAEDPGTRPRRAQRPTGRMSDRDGYGPIGTLSGAERAWDRRLAAAGHAALGRRMLGRDADGHLVAAATLSSGPGTTHESVTAPPP